MKLVDLCCQAMKELSPPNLNLRRLFEDETQSCEPILFILSPGADPSQELEDLARVTIGIDKYHQVCIHERQFNAELNQSSVSKPRLLIKHKLFTTMQTHHLTAVYNT